MSQSEIDAVRALLGSKPRPVGWHQRRQRIEEVGAVWPAASDIKFEEAGIAGLRGEWSIAPGSDASRVLLYFHGGGYCSGSILSHRRLVTEAGRASKTRTLAIEYRLAPEHPFPAAVEDACAATAWIADHAAELAIDPTCLAVAGDSAGGTLAAVVCQTAKGSGLKIALQVLLCPVTDIAPDNQSRREFAEGYFLEGPF